MSENKIIPTIYQGLNKMLNLDGFGFDNTTPATPQQQNQGKIIIKGQTPEEIHAKGLELEQKREIQRKFYKTSDRSFQKALQYEAGRLQAYMDYESMEYYPLIASALDLYMEEATTIGVNGKMLNIYSNKERIKYLLEKLFYDIINVNVNLPFWTRNLTKYGDNFNLIYGERKKGIIHVKQFVNYEIERIEKFIDGKPLIKFKERMTGDEFNPFEIAHFRLLGDDKYIPYGSSILNKIRRVFRQLCLDKNTNIWTPNGSTKIKDLKIGDDIYSYDYTNNKTIISKVKNVIKTGDKERFKVKTKNNEIILTDDHPLLTINKNNNKYSYKNIKEIDLKIDKIVSAFILDPNNKHNHYISSEILSIENVGVDEVWDIEVDNELHNFIANGLVVHNCMAEDAMLTYRLVRAGEKKVFKIDVGNIDEDDIEEYMYKVATKFKKTSQVNPNDGQFDYRYNVVGVDEDYFIPVRNANTQTGIDTLPGADNLNAIQDIDYLRNNLLSGLGIPKPFVSFEDAAGGGKNLAQFDIRFSKKVNRIQQAMIQELNKIAMIHLYLLGYSGDDLTNFTLTLTNPSTQQELMKAELMREQAQTYKELTGSEGGIAAMSHTSAKRLIFNMSDREIVEDLKQQKMERAISQELQDAPLIIKKTGLFKDIDAKYGEPMEGLPISGSTDQTQMPPTGGEMSGGAPMNNNMTPTAPPTGGNETGGGNVPAPPAGGNEGGGGIAGEMPLAEDIYGNTKNTNKNNTNNNNINNTNNNNNKFISNNLNNLINELVYGSTTDSTKKKELEYKSIIVENDTMNSELNDSAMRMISEIDNLLENGNNDDNNDEEEEILIEDLDNSELLNEDLDNSELLNDELLNEINIE